MKKHLVGFVAGAATGVALAIAAKKFMETEQGQQTAENAKKVWKDFSKFLEEKKKMIKSMTNVKYKDIVVQAAKEYGKIKSLPDEMVDELIKRTLVMWNEFGPMMEM